MKVGVQILPRNEVLDSQGRAVEQTLRVNGMDLSACRVGRYVELDIPESDREKAMARAKEITEYVLYNPLIESYELKEI